METPNLFDLHIDGESSRFLKEISRWSKFLSILGFVMCGFLFLASLVFILGGSNPVTEEQLRAAGYSVATLGYIYLVCVVVSFIPYLYLYQFAVKMQRALHSSDQETLNGSFSKLKSCFKYIGVMTIIMMGFLVLGIIVLNFVALT